MNLFCIPHAGGSCVQYLTWKELLNSSIHFMPLDLAGHAYRVNEKAFETVEEATADIVKKLKKLNNNDEYAIFGHSMGAIIAYAVYLQLEAEGEKLPSHIFFSGMRDPYHFKNDVKDSYSDEEGYRRFVQNVDGMKEQSNTDSETRDYFIKLIKQDLEMLGRYNPPLPLRKINVPVTVLYGENDPSMTYRDLTWWKILSDYNISFCRISGNHFFVMENARDTVNVINKMLVDFLD